MSGSARSCVAIENLAMNKYSRLNRLLVVKSAVLASFLAPLAGIPVVQASQGFMALAIEQAVENPGLLPTNPFYFLKSLRRSTQRALTVNPVKRADLELDILSQKAGELKRLQEVLDGGDENVKAATIPYKESLERLSSSLASVKETSKSPAVDQLLSKLLETGLKHLVLFDGLAKEADGGMRDRLEALDVQMSDVIASALTSLDSEEKLRVRLDQVSSQNSGDLLVEISLVRALGRVEDGLSDDSFARNIISIEKDSLFAGIISKMENREGKQSVPDVFDGISGNVLKTIEVVDEIRERIGDSELKNTLAIVRQRMLDIGKDEKSISKPESSRLIAEVGQLLSVVSSAGQGVKSNSVNTLVAKAKFNLTQADASFASGQYEDAAGQASVALAAAKNAMSYLARADKSALEQEVQGLKNQFDSLLSQAKELGVANDGSALAFVLLMRAEKSLGSVSDLLGNKLNLDKTVSALRDVNLVIERANVALRNLESEINKAASAKRASQPLIQRVMPVDENKERELKKEAIQEVNRAVGN